MEQYDVRIFPTAQQDLMDVIDYLNTLSKEAALNFYDRLVSEIASLSTMPERCPRPRDLALAAKGYRYLIVKNYLVFYVIVGDTVQITAGPLEGFMGLVEAIDTENFKVKLKVNMFGRETPAEVEIGQVELP